ncbi:putative hydrolase or acyltransferase (alpha/beta hydrolase superfamily) [Wenxinia marina DSM 24838]|uniref:Wenxma_12, whole genome shotgun sequence n=1 Tax=Wenxinia marina DSM 24838 TaxID=1123501 RepID=A0A0D0PAX6_9RHOB|nr:putative hydrolase or acyltransferase (alpha/beta hydrolase superfamily) [Wenxinia marina DSM 24838]
MRLNRVEYDSEGGAVPVLIAHGLLGSARNWGVIARRLSNRGPVIAVDMRNHGDSDWADSQSYPDMGGDLADSIDGTWDVVGHSMGGKAAMCLALAHPGKVRRLVVADIAPVAYTHTQQQNIDAMRRVDLATVESRSEAAAQMGVEDPGGSAFLLQSLDLKARRWRPNLDVLAAEMPGIVGFPEVTGSFQGPVLFLVGGGVGLRPARAPGADQGAVPERAVREDSRGRALAARRQAAGVRGGGAGVPGRVTAGGRPFALTAGTRRAGSRVRPGTGTPGGRRRAPLASGRLGAATHP